MDTVISNIGQLITPTERTGTGEPSRYHIHVTQDTQLYIQNGRIRSQESLGQLTECQTIDAHGGVIMPGLVDPFWAMPILPSWISTLRDSVLPNRDLLGWTQRLLHRAVRSGVTSVEVKCPHDPAFDGLSALGHLERQRQPRVVGSLLASLPGTEQDDHPSVSQLISHVIPEIRRRRLATFFDVGLSDHDDLAAEGRTILRAAGGAGLRPKLHIRSGKAVSEIVSLALSLAVAAIEGASHLPMDAVTQLAENGVVPVYLPSLLGHCGDEVMDVRPLIDQGLPMAIGSGRGRADGVTSSMWFVLAAAMERMKLSLPEAIVTCTINNASAIDLSHEVGSLEPGKSADLILLDLVDYRELGPALTLPPVSMVMINGEVVYSA